MAQAIGMHTDMEMDSVTLTYGISQLLDLAQVDEGVRKTGAFPFPTERLDVANIVEHGGEVVSRLDKGTLARIPALEPFIWEVPINEFDTVEDQIVHGNKKQPRKVFDEDEMAKLTTSLKDEGQLDPIHVVPYIVQGKVRLITIDGESRLRALTAMGAKSVKVKVHWVQSEAQLFKLSLILNLARSDHNPVEKAEAFAELIRNLEEEGVRNPQAEIARKLKLSPNEISNFLSLLELIPPIREMIMKGDLPRTYAIRLVEHVRALGEHFDQNELFEELKQELTTVRERQRARGVDHTQRIRGKGLMEKDVRRVR